MCDLARRRPVDRTASSSDRGADDGNAQQSALRSLQDDALPELCWDAVVCFVLCMDARQSAAKLSQQRILIASRTQRRKQRLVA